MTFRDQYGTDAVRFLIEEVGKYPNLYSQDFEPKQRIFEPRFFLTIKEDWTKVMNAIWKQYGDQVFTESVWFTWITTRHSHVHQNSKAWEIPYLDPFTQSTRSEDSPACSSKKSRPLAEEYGDQIIYHLLFEIEKYALLHDHNFVRKYANPDQLEPGDKMVWDEVMLEVRTKFPEATSEKAWTFYRQNCHYSTASKKWRPSLTFLKNFHTRKTSSSPNSARKRARKQRPTSTCSSPEKKFVPWLTSTPPKFDNANVDPSEAVFGSSLNIRIKTEQVDLDEPLPILEEVTRAQDGFDPSIVKSEPVDPNEHVQESVELGLRQGMVSSPPISHGDIPNSTSSDLRKSYARSVAGEDIDDTRLDYLLDKHGFCDLLRTLYTWVESSENGDLAAHELRTKSLIVVGRYYDATE
ncbi:hypothetical protein L596_019669 [Steinernema carpocapsae]|uniref:Uncharacterized protein n=1 Tax=Steinernema carpocapsae TaxID=34508 RepID=A0A4U5MRQ1_STECR|nr:hypothetical protein L596_019669 [Steinernema carpocapsae]